VSASSFTALSLVVLGDSSSCGELDRRGAERHLRFFVFSHSCSSVPLMDAYLHRHFLPQPNRYTAEMEMGLTLLAVPAIAWSGEDFRAALGSP